MPAVTRGSRRIALPRNEQGWGNNDERRRRDGAMVTAERALRRHRVGAGAQSPPAASANQLHLDIVQRPVVVRNGDDDQLRPRSSTTSAPSRATSRTSTSPCSSRAGRAHRAALAARSIDRDHPAWPDPRSKLIGPFPTRWTSNAGVVALRARGPWSRAATCRTSRVRPTSTSTRTTVTVVIFTPSITIDKVGSITGPARRPRPSRTRIYRAQHADPG